jgi:pyruvate/2-oxoglutarate dehydrogenase complex dihydrolipoamide acyltransferase (E2) component
VLTEAEAMVRWEFRLPDIGEGVTEGEIVKWLVTAGHPVVEDQPIVEVMTDKATVTIAAPKSGIVAEMRGKVGDVVKVHEVLIVFELDEEGTGSSTVNGQLPRAEPPVPALAVNAKEVLATGGAAGAAAVPGYFNDRPLATPATRKLAREKNVDLRRIAPSGPQGRVTRKDVETSPPTAFRRTGLTGRPSEGPIEARIPLAGLRRKIAQHMSLSKRTAAHFTFVEECDVTALKALRAQLKAPAADRGVKLTFLPFIVKATALALKKHPMLNAMLDEATNEIVLRNYVHIGIATATDAGLLVPVIKDANLGTLLDIAREIDRLASEARTGKAKLEDLYGSTFTITSLGERSGLLATPIVNFPEVAILGVHRMKQRPVVRDGQIVIGDVMLLSLSFDHRIVDGHVGAAFAYDIIAFLEQPNRLFLEMA